MIRSRDRAETALVAYAAGLAAAAVALAAALLASGVSFGSPPAVAALVLIAMLTESQSVRLSSTTEVSVSFLPIVFAAVVFGPLAAMAVGGASLLTQFRRDHPSGGDPYVRWTVWTASRVLVAGAAGLAALATGASGAATFGRLVVAVAAASTAEVLADLVLNAATVAIRRTGSLRELARLHAPILLAAVPLYTPVIALLAYAYDAISPWSVALFAIPAFAAQRLFLLYREQRDANDRLERANLSFATALVATLDARDRYTAGHSAAVAIYARDIARALGLPESEQQLVHLAGLVHDIGKVGLPPGLLEKPGPLTPEERRAMEEHAAIGERILGKVEDYARIAAIVRHHHERVDGNGYPDGLGAPEIPLLSRIISVADAYDAMTSDRPYRDALAPSEARARLAEAAGIQFDAAVVAAFDALLEEAPVAYRSGSREDFSFDVQEELRADVAVA